MNQENPNSEENSAKHIPNIPITHAIPDGQTQSSPQDQNASLDGTSKVQTQSSPQDQNASLDTVLDVQTLDTIEVFAATPTTNQPSALPIQTEHSAYIETKDKIAPEDVNVPFMVPLEPAILNVSTNVPSISQSQMLDKTMLDDDSSANTLGNIISSASTMSQSCSPATNSLKIDRIAESPETIIAQTFSDVFSQNTLVDSPGHPEQKTEIQSSGIVSVSYPTPSPNSVNNPFNNSMWQQAPVQNIISLGQSQEFSATRIEGTDLYVGSVIGGKYRIVETLGKGGMGIVFKVEHLLLPSKKFFALKLLHAHLSRDESFRRRFVREVEMAMEFTHENAVQIRDFGETNEGCQYFTMDFSTGRRLSDILKAEGSLAFLRAISITKQVLGALQHAHSKGIVHRDLKPDNILIEYRFGRDFPLVLDFGIAKLFNDASEEKLTQKAAIGTPLYMSPEQAEAEEVDVRTDIYSMGVILYQMITAKLPFSGSTRDILFGHIVKPVPLPRDVRPDLNITEYLQNIILKALQKDRNARFVNAQEFIEQLEQFERGNTVLLNIPSVNAMNTPTAVTTVSSLSPNAMQEPSRKSTSRIMGALFAIVILVCLVGYWIHHEQIVPYQKYYHQFVLALQQEDFTNAEVTISQIEQLWLYQNKVIQLHHDLNLAKQKQKLRQEKQVLLCSQIQESLAKDSLDVIPELLQQLVKIGASQADIEIWQQRYNEAKQAQELFQQGCICIIQDKFEESLVSLAKSQAIRNTPKISRLISIVKNCITAQQHAREKNWKLAVGIFSECQKDLQELGISCDFAFMTIWNKNLESELAEQKKLQEQQERQRLEKEKERTEKENIRLIEQKFQFLEKVLQNKDSENAQQILKTLQEMSLPSKERRKLEQLMEQYEILATYKKILHAKTVFAAKREVFELQEFVSKYPQNPYKLEIDARLRQAQALIQKDRVVNLQEDFQEGKKLFEAKKYSEASEKFLSFVEDNGYQLLPEKARHVKQMLGICYCMNNDWEKALDILENAGNDPVVIGYKGLCYYNFQNDAKAIECISRSLQSSIPKTLKQQLQKANLEILERSYPQNKQELFRAYKTCVEDSSNPIPEHIRKIGLLAKELGDNTQALIYLQRYVRNKNAQEDREVLDAILSLQDYQPIQEGYRWTYRVQKIKSNEISEIYFQVLSQNYGEYSVRDSSGDVRQWSKNQGFFIRENKKKFPIPVTLRAVWDRDQFTQAQLVSCNELVKTDAGEFYCIVILVTSSQSSSIVTKEYFAPDVGEVRAEIFQDNQKIYQRDLIAYSFSN